MTTTTDFGSWNNHGDSYELTVEGTVLNYINGGDSDWRERVETSGAFDRMVSDYRDAIQAALPEGVYLTGNEFIGPAYEADYTWTGDLDLHARIEAVDLAPIVERHDPDNAPAAAQQSVTLVSAAPGDVVPGHELADPDCPEVPGLTDRPEVQAFFAAHGYGPDNETELMYLVTDGSPIPAGYPTLPVEIASA